MGMGGLEKMKYKSWESIWNILVKGYPDVIIVRLLDTSRKRVRFALKSNDEKYEIIHVSSLNALLRWSIIEPIDDYFQLRHDCYKAMTRPFNDTP